MHAFYCHDTLVIDGRVHRDYTGRYMFMLYLPCHSHSKTKAIVHIICCVSKLYVLSATYIKTT